VGGIVSESVCGDSDELLVVPGVEYDVGMLVIVCSCS
jgi:hypothetical protein